MINIYKLLNYFKLLATYVRFNWCGQLEYRGAFLVEGAGMFINNVIWLAFWLFFFHSFPTIPTWTQADVVTLWAISTAGFGLAFVIFGNCRLLAQSIVRGELDAWMLYPRRLLSHFILGKMKASAFGDFMFGIITYVLLVKPDFIHLSLFFILTISVALLFVAFSIMVGSLAFFLGQAENIAPYLEMGMITFSVYPSPLFEGRIRLLLYTVIPAIFVSYYPIEALRQLSLLDTFYAFAGSLSFTVLSVLVFYFGLKRYESGNLTAMRG